MSTPNADQVYLEKVYTYIVDPAFDGHVLGYLRSMAAEYAEQADRLLADPTNPSTGEALNLAVAIAKRDAYLDAVRVLADADDAAYCFATEATR